jgi:Fe(3+) dicitrate transport protein
VTPTSDGHVFQDRSGGTEASAYYIDDKIDVGNWTITPGIRFEHINTDWRDRPVLDNRKPVPEKNRSITSNEPLPALSVMYHMSDAWKLFANYETSFGSLQYFQLGQGGSGNRPPMAWSRRRPRPTKSARAMTMAALPVS